MAAAGGRCPRTLQFNHSLVTLYRPHGLLQHFYGCEVRRTLRHVFRILAIIRDQFLLRLHLVERRRGASPPADGGPLDVLRFLYGNNSYPDYRKTYVAKRKLQSRCPWTKFASLILS